VRGTTPELLDFIKEESDIPLVAVGEPVDVNGLMLSLNDCPERLKQQHSLIHLLLDRDPAFGPNQPLHKNKTLSLLLMSPTRKMQAHFSFFHLQHLSWRTSIIDFALYVLALPLKDYDQTLLYSPHPHRSPEDALARCAYMMAVPPGWTCQLLPPDDFPTEETTVTSTLTGKAQPLYDNDAETRQLSHDRKLMNEGAMLSPFTVQFKTEKEMVEERKREMRRRQVQAATELQQEKSQAAEVVKSDSDEEIGWPTPLQLAQAEHTTRPRTASQSSRDQPKKTKSQSAEAEKTSPALKPFPPSASPLLPSREERKKKEAALKRKAQELEDPERTSKKSPPAPPTAKPMKAPSYPAPVRGFTAPRRKSKENPEPETTASFDDLPGV